MRRRTFDLLASAAGGVLALVLIAGGSLLLWAHYYIADQVHNQLAAQEVYFPPKAAFAHPKPGTEITPSMIPVVSQYAGQQLLTGAQAEVYADHFIAVHLSEMPYRGVYATISAQVQAHPNDAALKSLQQTSFEGTMLRATLLEAYAFGTVGSIAGWAAVVCFAGAGLLLILAGFGIVHARRVGPEVELLRRNQSTGTGEPPLTKAV
jgi:hypothetical protein